MSPFTLDAAAALAGPAWLRSRRRAAAEQVAASSLPSPEDELWRYSRIAELDLDAFTPVGDQAPARGSVLSFDAERSVAVLTVDGVLTVSQVDGELARRGLVVRAASEADADLLGSAMPTAPDVFATMNDAFAASPIVVRVPAGMTVTAPIVVEHSVGRDSAATFPRLVVEAGPDSEVTVLERYVSDDVVAALVVPVVELVARQAARVRYLAVNDLGSRAWMIGNQVACGERDSSTLLSTVALGGDYARVRTDARLDGIGAEGRQIAVYFGEGTQMHDFRTIQHHVAPKTTSDLLFKGAVEGHAKSVYTGLIRIGKHAKGASAFQTNRNLKLSEGAWAESVPNLEIENNDVRCSHASAVGPIDEDQRFYLESRGVPPAIAERLIVLGFFDEVIAQLPVPAIADRLRREVGAKLDRRES